MQRIQDFFHDNKSQIEIMPGEYEGPLIIRHSCSVEFNNATLWAKNEPALSIIADNVCLKNLRVEIAKEQVDNLTAIYVANSNIQLDKVEIFGGITEILPDNSLNFEPHVFPRNINLGSFAANVKSEFPIKFNKIKKNYLVTCDVNGLNVTPVLESIKNELLLTVAPLKDATLIHGHIFLTEEKTFGGSSFVSKIIRRIYISGQAKAARVLEDFSPDKVPPIISAQIPKKNSSAQILPSQPAFSNAASITSKNKQSLKVSQTISAQTSPAYSAESFRVSFQCSSLPSGISIDSFALCLNSNNMLNTQDDIISFSNPRHFSYGVYLDSKKAGTGLELNLNLLPQNIHSVLTGFAIYDESNRRDSNFSGIGSPKVIVFVNEKLQQDFPVALSQEKAFIAIRFFRAGNAWNLEFVGKGNANGIEELCANYGSRNF